MRILITGATHGMGEGVAQALAERDGASHEIVLLGRSEERCRATLDELARRTGNQRLSSVVCDLTRLREVRRARDQLVERFDRLDALFVNAGLGYAPARQETEDGLDPHFQVNYLAHFLLTLNLMPLLERSEHGGRVVFNVTDFGEALDWDDLQMRERWGYERGVINGMVAKRLLLLRLHALSRRRGDPRVSFLGFQIGKTVWSNQLAIIPWHMRAMATLARLVGQFVSIEECGRIMAPLFTDDPEATRARSGRLLTSKGGPFTDVAFGAFALDEANQERLWRLSVELCADEPTRRLAEAYAAG